MKPFPADILIAQEVEYRRGVRSASQDSPEERSA